MTGVGFCDFCKQDVPVMELVMHITQKHQAFLGVPPLRWPDGGRVVIDTSLEPVDFMDEAERRFFAAVKASWWRRLWSTVRGFFTRD